MVKLTMVPKRQTRCSWNRKMRRRRRFKNNYEFNYVHFLILKYMCTIQKTMNINKYVTFKIINADIKTDLKRIDLVYCFDSI